MKSNNSLSYAEATELATDLTAKTAAKLYDKIDPMQVGKSARDLAIGEKYASNILKRLRGLSISESNSIANRLVNGYPSHEFVLDHDELADIGIPASLLQGEEAQSVLEIRKNLIPNINKRTIELMLNLSKGGVQNAEEEQGQTKSAKSTSASWKNSRLK
jgi:hypothetical protein